jgi:hypothetical protein
MSRFPNGSVFAEKNTMRLGQKYSVQFANSRQSLSCDWQWKSRFVSLENPFINVKSHARLARKRTTVLLKKVHHFPVKSTYFGVKSVYVGPCVFSLLQRESKQASGFAWQQSCE